MKIAIVEDDKKTQQSLNRYIQESLEELNKNAIIDIFSDGLEFIDQFNGNFDIIYMDIEMEHMDGMTTAQKIRETDTEVVIVFVTNHSQMAIQGYSVEASDFLLKPLNQFTFHEHFKKIIKKVKTSEKSLMLRVSGTVKRISENSIKYIESEGHYIDFITVNSNYNVIDTLKNIEKNLDEHQFYRCSNSHIVNFDFIEKIDKNTIYIDDYTLPISRSRKKDFMNKFTEYLGDQIL